MFSCTVALNRNGSSSTTLIAAPQRRQVDVAHVGAVDQHRALAHVVEPRRAAATSVVLPEPVAPTSATVVPAVDDEVDVAQRRSRRRCRSWKVTSRSSTRPRPSGQRRRTRRRDEPGLAVEDLEQPRARRRRALRQAERDAELAHRPDQHQQVRVERGEVAERERPVDHLAAADEQDHGEPDARQEADERVVERAQPRRDHRLVEHARDAAARSAASWRGSAANAFTTRTPETFSSTSAVSSAIRCWTSCSAGRERRP